MAKMIVNKYGLVLLLSLITVLTVQAQRQPSVKLWPNGAPGANPKGGNEITRIDPASGDQVVSNVHEPSITPYIPKASKATGCVYCYCTWRRSQRYTTTGAVINQDGDFVIPLMN